MTDNDIIKALECCGLKMDCIGCYFNTHEAEDICAREIVKNAFDLINRQRAEIERLKKYNTEVAYKHYNDGIKETAKEIIKSFENRFSLYYPHGILTYDDIENQIISLAEKYGVEIDE